MSAISLGVSLNGAKPKAWSVTEAFRGWSVSLTFPNWVNTRFEALSKAAVSVTDHRGVSVVCPSLLAGPRNRDHGKSRTSTMQLIDETSWRLGSGSESWDTFIGGDTTAIAAAVGSRFGVTVSGAPEIPVHIEDFKLCSGWSVLDRLERVYGGDIVIGSAGDVQFRPPGWISSLAPFRASSVRDHYDPLSRVGKIFVSKNLGQGTHEGPQYYTFTEPGNVSGPLAFPLGPGANPSYEGGVGVVGWVTLWDGPHTSGGRSLGTWPLTGDSGDEFSPPNTGVWPATHFTAIVYPDPTNSLPTQAILKISGAPYSDLPAGIDGAISREFGTGRGAPFAFSDTLIPSLAYAVANWPHWLRRANRGTNTMTAVGALDCRVRVGQTWGWLPLGLSGRIERVTHSGGGRVPTTEILVNCDEGGS